MYISWNGGTTWKTLQLNLPKTPITDLKIHQGDLIVATSGRGFWILDDLSILSQYKANKKSFKLYSPDSAYNGSWGSELNINKAEFKGANVFNGVNPANGVVIYYELPKLKKEEDIILEIKNSSGQLVRSITSKKDSLYKKYDGGPTKAPTLDKKQGLNRFVWDMRYGIMPGVPNVYIEANYKRHITPPGIYQLDLKVGDSLISSEAIIKENPLYQNSIEEYRTYDSFMNEMELNLTDMHNKVNSIYLVQKQLKDVIIHLKKKSDKSDLVETGNKLLSELKKWDEEMVQRKSKAYDDVENFPNKFTANYLFLINQSENILPKINQSSLDRKKELDLKWQTLKNQAEKFINSDIPAFNKQLWDAGVGAIKLN